MLQSIDVGDFTVVEEFSLHQETAGFFALPFSL